MNRTLDRTLTLKDLVFLTVGAVIGSGIFIVPGAVLRQTGGHLGVALLVWLIAGLLSLLGALTYGELSAANPEAGGIYVYIRDAFGRPAAFLYGWTLFFMISGGAIATLAVAFATYLNQIISVTGTAAKLVAVGMIVTITAINVRGTRGSANVQNVTTAIKAGAVLLMSLFFLVAGKELASGDVPLFPTTAGGNILTASLTAMIGVLWAYEGWQYVTFSAGEVKDAQRNFPRGIVIGTGILILLYCMANVGYVAALGSEAVAATDTVAADAVSAMLGSVAGKFIAAVILVAMFSSANSILLTSPRVYFAMARDGVFFRKLAEVHPRFGTPAWAIIAQSLVAIALAVSGTFEQLLTYVVFTGWIFYALGAASIFALRRGVDVSKLPFRVPGYPVTPILFVIASGAIVINTIVAQPVAAAIGLAIVFTGVPAYFIWQRTSAAQG